MSNLEASKLLLSAILDVILVIIAWSLITQKRPQFAVGPVPARSIVARPELDVIRVATGRGMGHTIHALERNGYQQARINGLVVMVKILD